MWDGDLNSQTSDCTCASCSGSWNLNHWTTRVSTCSVTQLCPTRLVCSWDFPGKNTGVDRHFSSRDLPDHGIKPRSPASPALAGKFSTTEPPGEPLRPRGKSQFKDSERNQYMDNVISKSDDLIS